MAALIGLGINACKDEGGETPNSLGEACVPRQEWANSFSGFEATEVSVDVDSPFCGGETCLLNYFRGRVSCPYGQNVPELGDDGIASGVNHAERCAIPAGDPTAEDDVISVPVAPQLLERRPEDAVYCSCRCDGPNPDVNYCACGSGFECRELIPDLGFNADTAGSYCVRSGTFVADPGTIASASCDRRQLSCGDETPLPAGSLEEIPSGPDNAGSYFITQMQGQVPPKVDLLVVVDNSPGMADKQALLAEAIPEFVERLANPACIGGGQRVTPSAGESCPEGTTREIRATMDVNLAVITSSLGTYGAAGPCTEGERIDMAHLLGALPRGSAAIGSGTVTDPAGFLSWRSGQTFADFSAKAAALVASAGEDGCGYEATLESMYRFLVDPAPYARTVKAACRNNPASTCVTADGLDQALLDQRAAFLRPDSELVVLLASDENDCSVRVGGAAYVVAEHDPMQLLWRSSSVCETNPNDPCCYSCGLPTPGGCAADLACGDPGLQNEASDFLTSELDKPGLRCAQNKKRFGIDFLYPVSRYVNALTQPTLCTSHSDLSSAECTQDGEVRNPLFAPSAESTGVVRSPLNVHVAGILGVPWQDLAVDANDSQALVYKDAAALTSGDTWNLLLGPPDDMGMRGGYFPADPLMMESSTPRVGVHPITSEELASTEAPTRANAINGHEWDAEAVVEGELQYACIAALAEPRECDGAPGDRTCPCGMATDAASVFHNPLCQSPNDDSYGATQYFTAAFPSLRPLMVLEAIGNETGNSVVASACARNVVDQSLSDYGYRPAIDAMIAALRPALAPRCLPRALPVTEDNALSCHIVEARPVVEACACSGGDAREALEEGVESAARANLESAGVCSGSGCDSFCMCGISALTGDALTRCLNDPASSDDGFCYIDPDQGLGAAELVEQCPGTLRRMLRFLGKGAPSQGSVVLLACGSGG